MTSCHYCGTDSPRIKRAELPNGNTRCIAMSGCIKRMRARVGVRLELETIKSAMAFDAAAAARRELAAARYRDGICIDCGEQPHSPGRPRCDACHAKLVEYRSGGNRYFRPLHS